jgi:hypothetical protein
MQPFFSKHFLTKFLMFLSKNGISRSAKRFLKVDLDLWGENTTFFFHAFFDKNFDVFVKKRHFTNCLTILQSGFRLVGSKRNFFLPGVF